MDGAPVAGALDGQRGRRDGSASAAAPVCWLQGDGGERRNGKRTIVQWNRKSVEGRGRERDRHSYRKVAAVAAGAAGRGYPSGSAYRVAAFWPPPRVASAKVPDKLPTLPSRQTVTMVDDPSPPPRLGRGPYTAAPPAPRRHAATCALSIRAVTVRSPKSQTQAGAGHHRFPTGRRVYRTAILRMDTDCVTCQKRRYLTGLRARRLALPMVPCRRDAIFRPCQHFVVDLQLIHAQLRDVYVRLQR